MTFATLQRKSDTAASPRGASPARGLRVGDAHNSYEQEADRVADRVAGGGHIGGWSVAKLDMSQAQGEVQRQAAPAPPSTADKLTAGAGKLAEAFLQTDIGKKLLEMLKGDPLVKGAEDFVSTLPGKIITGAAAAGAVSGLAAAHKALPAQPPAIPLDMVKPGLSVKLTYEGPVDHPKSAMITFSYTPGTDTKKPTSTRAERQRDENATLAADQEKFRSSLKYKEGSAHDLEQKAEQQAVSDSVTRRGNPLYLGGRPAQPSPPQPPSGLQLQAPSLQPHYKTPAPALLDQKLQLAPITSAPAAAKREEPVVQRKTASPGQLSEGQLAEGATSVQDLLASSSGRPLDRETRRYMEGRFGYDFSRVRVHTGAAAAASAKQVGALAYTVGSNVVFGTGRYAPATTQGRRLLAHELTHVVQQSAQIAARPVGIRPAPVQVQRDVDDAVEDHDSGSWFSGPIEKVKKMVRKLPGYKLFAVILGRDPISDEVVKRTPTKLLQGVLNLVPGGDAAFERIEESGALEKAFDWVSAQIDQLGLSWDYFKGLVNEAYHSLKLGDISDPEAALVRVAEIFKPALEKVKAFAKAVLNKVFEIAMQVVMEKLGGGAILDILRKAGDTFLTIVRDPVGFLKNLVQALGQGFNQFKDHILDHLKEGVVQWLFGQIATTGLKLPKKFDLAGIIGMVLQVLGLTYDKFRAKLVGLLSEEGVVFLEGAFDFLVKIAQAKDLSVAWKMILAKADQLVDTVLDSVKQWVVTKIVTMAIVKLATLFNPVGAIIQAIQTIYTTVNFFIEKAKQLAALVEAITNSLSAIASGNLTKAADFVEASMAKAIPPILGFLADLIGLGGIGEQVRKIVHGVQERVDKAIDKVLDYVVGKGKAFYEKGKAAAGKILEWWRQRKDVLIGEEEHSIYMEGTEDAPTLMIASVPGVRWTDYLEGKKVPAGQKPLLVETRKLAAELEKPLSASSTPEEKAKRVEEKRKLFDTIAKNIVALGFSGEQKAPASIIHYGAELSEDEGGIEVDAPLLTRNHPQGSVPSDEPKVWKKLGSLVQKKSYVQGHLLNHNLGGEGRRFNLSPINKKANADHLSKVERDVKTQVNKEKKVMSYKVKAVYGKHPGEPKRLTALKSLAAAGPLKPKQEKDLAEYEAEQKLCTEFQYETYQLTYSDQSKKWEKVESTKVSGKVDNTIDLST
ncbi:MAG TPA: DUF4157 domain-containing protein [Acidisarcina sp.]